MKKPVPFLRKTLLSLFVGSLCASPALAFNPDEYKTSTQTISVDGKEMVKLRIYAPVQTVEFKQEDMGPDEDDLTYENTRSFNENDRANVQGAMRYVKAVFGVPKQAPTVETFTNDEDQASFSSPMSSQTPGIYGTRLSTWYTDEKKATDLPVAVLEIGAMGDKDGDSLRQVTVKGEGASMTSVIVHEMMHGMGIATNVEKKKEGENTTYLLPQATSLFSNHLYDIYGNQLKPGMVFKRVPLGKKGEAKTDAFYQYENKEEESFAGAYFSGDNVKQVLTVDGKQAAIAWPDDNSDVEPVAGIPINGYEMGYDADKKRVTMPELSHLELQNSMMSHQNYRNWGTFMEAELAVLQDIGFTGIDRRKFFGFSIYNNDLTYENNNGFDSQQDWGVGLHIYGSSNTITQKADLKTTGEDAYGIRIDGIKNKLTVLKDTQVSANGKDGVGIAVSYGRSHELNIQGNVEATGSGGNALRFDFGGNLLGDNNEYRGSYFQVNQDEDTEKWENVDSSVIDALRGPLANSVDISGSLNGRNAAIYISDNAFVKEINVLNGATITGDIVSEWSPSENRYGEYGDGMTLFKPASESGRTLLSFGYQADEDGKATEYADENFEMTYSGDISGADGINLQLAGGQLTYGGDAVVNAFQAEEDTVFTLSNGTVTTETFSSEGTVEMAGTSGIAIVGEEPQAQLDKVTVAENADATINAGEGEVEINVLKNEGNTLFQADTVKEEQITINTYEGEDGSTLSLDLSSKAADQISGSSTEAAIDQGAQVLAVENNTNNSDLYLHIAEGEINGEINAVIDGDGNLLSASEKKNASAAVLNQIAANNFQVFRAQMNDLDKRMGDLRNMPGESGAWAKVIAGQSQYKSMHNDYKTLQLGVDHRFGNFFGGVTAAYTDGDGSLKHGSTDDKNYTFGLYGGWLAEDGQFVDVTLKHHHLETDYDFKANSKRSKGSYDTSGTSFSIEYGWRLGLGDAGYYIEPQAEFMYGHLNSTGFTTSRGVKVDQSSIKSKIGRLGVAAGWVSPDKKGSVYVKASVLNDWDADSVIHTSKNGAKRRYHEDMGGTWGEFAVGGTWHINKNLSAYGEMETTAGSPVRTTYQFNAGLRLNF